MAIGIKSVTVGKSIVPAVSVTTSESPQATAIGDAVVVFHCNDYFAISTMPAPTVTGSPTVSLLGSYDSGSPAGHVKVYGYYANTAGAQTISSTHTGTADEEKFMNAIVLSGVDGTSIIDGTAVGAEGASGNPVAPSVSPSNADSLLLCHTNTDSADGAGHNAAPYTPPGGMTEQYDSVASNNFMSESLASQQLSASGATGTRTFTATSMPWLAISLAIKAAPSGAVVPLKLESGLGFLLTEGRVPIA